VAKVTSKLQVTVPRVVADRYGIRPGDEIEWEPAGDVIRVLPPRAHGLQDLPERLRRFDQATARQRQRQRRAARGRARQRGWTREELYERGRAR
jgi:bifunctional DNA-binding transcriptional regulator/antitoxin component of YhaV-PrlF toxin-antitoxin module